MTASNVFLVSVNTSITFIIGFISFLIVYNGYKKAEVEIVKEFSKRMMVLIVYLTLLVVYWALYEIALQQFPLAIYPLYFTFVLLFLFMIWSLFSFERLVRKFGVSEEDKLDRMTTNELEK